LKVATRGNSVSLIEACSPFSLPLSLSILLHPEAALRMRAESAILQTLSFIKFYCYWKSDGHTDASFLCFSSF